MASEHVGPHGASENTSSGEQFAQWARDQAGDAVRPEQAEQERPNSRFLADQRVMVERSDGTHEEWQVENYNDKGQVVTVNADGTFEKAYPPEALADLQPKFEVGTQIEVQAPDGPELWQVRAQDPNTTVVLEPAPGANVTSAQGPVRVEASFLQRVGRIMQQPEPAEAGRAPERGATTEQMDVRELGAVQAVFDERFGRGYRTGRPEAGQSEPLKDWAATSVRALDQALQQDPEALTSLTGFKGALEELGRAGNHHMIVQTGLTEGEMQRLSGSTEQSVTEVRRLLSHLADKVVPIEAPPHHRRGDSLISDGRYEIAQAALKGLERIAQTRHGAEVGPQLKRQLLALAGLLDQRR